MTNLPTTGSDHRSAIARDMDALLFDTSSISEGDAVVHLEHGLAKFVGHSQIEVDGETQSLIALEYRNGGKLMLPDHELADVWPYGATAKRLTLDRLDNDDWTTRRDALVVELREAAGELMRLDAERRTRKAPAIQVTDTIAEKLDEGFAYDLTADQHTAITDTLSDMANTLPMNRIVIGDVGYGKTEIAIRAVIAAVLGGYQAVIAAPTTVLARQHFQTLTKRLSPLGLEIAELSRLTSDKQVAELKDAVASGACDVVVGTHALTTADLSFKRLALVVVDEEQKFGADQKEALHHMGRGAHVLTMTATPIPRTLAAAQVGLCDVSVVATAPKSRLPIETRVEPNDSDALLAALEREIARGGQCYVVCPRIAGVEEVAALLKTKVDGFSLDIAHGKLPKEEIEASMLRFMNGETDVLLSTSIIESGLDNGRANTMVVWNADRFGLSQLHQLRGRIGRAELPAHMVLMTKVKLDGDSDAIERLKTFASINELGAGFRIARLDREMRGYGSLAGDEQSGQISQLGIGLYQHILAKELKAFEPGADGKPQS